MAFFGADKWGIPFFYPTAPNAGVSGTGSGFFWQQKGDIKDDSDDGMVRLGKEFDDVDIISTSTGEFEFPFGHEGDSDGLALQHTTGHHSGGESHGCEGYTYFVECDMTGSSPKFTFKKTVYFGGASYTHGSGSWTNAAATGTILNDDTWHGYALCAYKNPGGANSGHNTKDSMILEVWWNQNPSSDIKKWVMLKRIEDKGGWGKGGDTCDGDPDQIGVWSAVQWRFKAVGSAPDFSLHPIIPEFEDGDNIHGIDGADNSFSENISRGYMKDKRIPRDTQMTCLFKSIDSQGTMRMKNLSLREIDPSSSFGDNTSELPGGTGGTTSTLAGNFVINRDINYYRESACAPGGSTKFYGVSQDTEQNSWTLNNPDDENRDKIGILAYDTSSTMIGIPIVEAQLWLKKTGSPTGTANVRIQNATGQLMRTLGSIDVSTISTSWTIYSFIDLANTYKMQVNNIVFITWANGDANNYIRVGKNNSLSVGSTIAGHNRACWHKEGDPNSVNSTNWNIFPDREIPGELWKDT